MRSPRSLRSESMFDALEPRLVMAGTSFSFEAYYPEGFSSDTINEFVPVTNPNPFPVEVQLEARYESGTRDQIIGTQTIPANTRYGFVVSDSQNGGGQGTRENEPYALVVKATGRVSANFSHYDFGTAIGESFTESKSTDWSFAEGEHDHRRTDSQDFLLLYNPNSVDAHVTLTVYTAAGLRTFTTTIGPERRGGWAINDLPGVDDGGYGSKISSDVPVVAVQSRYKPSQGRGYGTVGTSGGGATAGVIAAGEFSDDFYTVNGDDSRLPRTQADSFVSILNTNATPATVKLVFMSESHGGTILGRQTVTVNAQSKTTLSLRTLGLPQNDEFGIAYSSDIAVTLTGTVYQGLDAVGAEAAPTAATTWDFGEGYMSRSRGGSGVLEELYFFNPTSTKASITISLFLNDGTTAPITILDEGGSLELSGSKLHENATLRLGAEDRFYGIRVTSNVPIVAFFTHWDSGNGGGFGTLGMPSGTVQSLSALLPPSFFTP